MINKLESKISLNIKGKNINRFIKKLVIKKISILKINYKNKNEANIIIYKKDYEKLKKVKSIYNITELEVFGIIKVKKNIIKNKHILIILTSLSLMFIILTHTIFDITIIHSNKEIRKLLKKELKEKGIKKYSLRKSNKKLAKLKEDILNKYKDKIEWLEIERLGTKYIVRVEERKIPKPKEEEIPRDIIAKKKGIIKKVIAEKGEIVKDMDDYTEKGDLIITGNLTFNNKEVGKVKAEGKVYAEIWYITKTTYPLVINKETKTDNKQSIITVNFLNKKLELTPHKFKTKKTQTTQLLKHNLIPLSVNKENQTETKITSEILTFDEALEKAKEASINKVKRKLRKPEYIIRSAYLKSIVKKSTIEVEMFFAVYEDITDYREIGD